MVISYNKEEINTWKINNNLLLVLVNEHDKQFRKRHKCKCKNKISYSKEEWYCEAMQKSRMKNKKIRGLIGENLRNSPFLPNTIELPNHITKVV